MAVEQLDARVVFGGGGLTLTGGGFISADREGGPCLFFCLLGCLFFFSLFTALVGNSDPLNVKVAAEVAGGIEDWTEIELKASKLLVSEGVVTSVIVLEVER